MLLNLFSILFTALKGFTDMSYAETFLPSMLWKSRCCPDSKVSFFVVVSRSAFIMGTKSAEINGWETLLSYPHHTTAVAVVLLGASSSSLLTAPISCC